MGIHPGTTNGNFMNFERKMDVLVGVGIRFLILSCVSIVLCINLDLIIIICMNTSLQHNVLYRMAIQ